MLKILAEKLGLGGANLTPFGDGANFDSIVRAVVNSIAAQNGLLKASPIALVTQADASLPDTSYVTTEWQSLVDLVNALNTDLGTALTVATVAPAVDSYDETDCQTVITLIRGIQDALLDSTVLADYPVNDMGVAFSAADAQLAANAAIALKNYVNSFVGDMPIGF